MADDGACAPPFLPLPPPWVLDAGDEREEKAEDEEDEEEEDEEAPLGVRGGMTVGPDFFMPDAGE